MQFLPYERLIHHLRVTCDEDALKLADFLEERINTICS